jgi:hypothetical protein
VCRAKIGAARRPAKLPIVEKAMVKYGLCLRFEVDVAPIVSSEVAIESFGKILQRSRVENIPVQMTQNHIHYDDGQTHFGVPDGRHGIQ